MKAMQMMWGRIPIIFNLMDKTKVPSLQAFNL